MNAADAKRYNQYWKDLEDGKDLSHPGMSDVEYQKWMMGDLKVQEQLALNKVNPEEINALRMKEIWKQNEFLNGSKSKINNIENYEEFEKLSNVEKIELISNLNGKELYTMIDEGPGNVSWITKGYDRITPENIKDFVITYEGNGKIQLNLDWPKFGGYKIDTIKSIKDLSGKIEVSRDGGDGGYTMGIGRNSDGTYSSNSQRAIPKSSSSVNTGIFDSDLYKKSVDIIAGEGSNFSKFKKLIELGFDDDVARNMMDDYKAWLTRPEIAGENNIKEGFKLAGKSIETKYGYYGNAEEWIVGNIHMEGGAGQMNTVFSWGTLKESGIISNIGKAIIN